MYIYTGGQNGLLGKGMGDIEGKLQELIPEHFVPPFSTTRQKWRRSGREESSGGSTVLCHRRDCSCVQRCLKSWELETDTYMPIRAYLISSIDQSISE